MKKPTEITPQATMEQPAWATEEIPDLTYELTVYEPGGGSIMNLEMTREEFKTLRSHLAELRGYTQRRAA